MRMKIKRLARRIGARRMLRISGFVLFLASPGGLLLRFDPLVVLSVWSVLLLLTTVVWGRWFCGWVCPFGTYHGVVAKVVRRGRAGSLPRMYSSAQNLKYYLLALLVTASFTGTDLIGWLDPLCVFYRGLGVGQGLEVYQKLATDIPVSLSQWLNPSVSAAPAGVLPGGPGNALWGSLLALGLFLSATAGNFVRPRFWCLYVCPLGALLGLAASRCVKQLELDVDRCRSCHACSRACQSGAGPESHARWRASECFSCRSCQQLCPVHAIDFRNSRRERTN